MTEKEKIIKEAIAAAKAGRDGKAFERLFKCYYPSRLRYIKKRCRSEEDAEEICNDVFTYIWKHLREFE